uniref:Uncharacterized protein n=1 Tax=Anguilla anguilla TaxID=7936 RepID=A0A0E9WM20_ANGAN
MSPQFTHDQRTVAVCKMLHELHEDKVQQHRRTTHNSNGRVYVHRVISKMNTYIRMHISTFGGSYIFILYRCYVMYNIVYFM